MKSIPTILFILILSCTRQVKSVSGQSATNDSIPTGDTFDFKIKDGQIGNLKTGEQLTLVFEKLKDFIVEKDSIPECEGCNTYTPSYLVSDHNHENLFLIEPGWDSSDRDKLFRIWTGNKKFLTDKGIRVGMTVKDLKEKYEITEIDVGGETGVHAIVKGFKGSFGIESPRTNDWWKVNKQNISDTLKVNEIIIL